MRDGSVCTPLCVVREGLYQHYYLLLVKVPVCLLRSVSGPHCMLFVKVRINATVCRSLRSVATPLRVFR